ncbi:MAG: murein biosynthesis integral membrane protein MurJ, partial [Gammaproteobacteria bacterium]|nr:murein biosynthesis integral membrane protein MurJ [Gammaproteobacteria bacterium]
EAELHDLTRHVVGTLGGVLLIVTTLGVAGGPWLIIVFAPGFLDDPYRLTLAGDMLRITFPYLLLISLVACAGGIFNTYRRFALPAFTPVLLNLCLIGAALLLAPHFAEPVVALAWGVLLAGIAQLLFQIPLLARLGLLSAPRWDWHHPGVTRIRSNMLPILFGSSVAQVNILFDMVIASFLVAGSVSWLYFSDRMVEFPLGVFGIALATVVLPHLSSHYAKASTDSFDVTLDWALKLTVLIGVPAGLGLFALAFPILASVFQYGQFTANDTYMAGLSLMAYAVGLPAFIAAKVLAAAFFARQDTRTPVRCALISLAANAGMNVLFVLALVTVESPAPHAGLALATSLAAWLQARLLYRHLRAADIYRPRRGWLRTTLRVATACIAMLAVVWLLAPPLDSWSQWFFWQRAGSLAGLIATAVAVYFASLWIMRTPWSEYRDPTQ